jgi:Protein of unknown function (DUF2380)
MKTYLIPRSYLVTLWAVLFVSCGPTVAQSVAVFDFELIDTSLEGATRGARPDEQERLARLSDQLAARPVLARRYHADRKRGAGKQPASLWWLRYPVRATHRSRTRDHRHSAEGIESDPQHEHLRSRRFVKRNHCGHERGHARQYRRVVVTHARLAGSQSASSAWLWPPMNGGSIPRVRFASFGTDASALRGSRSIRFSLPFDRIF